MRIAFIKSLWGMSGALPEQLDRIKRAGYDGFEQWVFPHFEIRKAAEDRQLMYVALVQGQNPEQFQRDLNEAFDGGVRKVTVHTGSSNWTFEEGARFFEKALPIAKAMPFEVNFETHRGRLLYEPLQTVRYLREFPDLYLCADLSHWTVVTESMLGGYANELDLALRRTRHIHARVGFEEGPQVPDPRVEQWEGPVKTFEGWWDRIKKAHEDRGAELLTVDPEFGPPNYLWTDPMGNRPLADLWDVCLWMRDRLKKRWSPE